MPTADDSGLHLGSVLDGRYRIDAVLGSGGMGRVYRGEHTGIGKAVAIKVLHADLGRNSEAAQRFQREALASGRLDHANIVGVSDFGIIEDGPCYLVMEALEGESLGDRLVREKRLPWPEAFAILRGVLAGLHHAHERGVVHRDIKPDNIFLALKDGAPVIKILDFGIAKLAAGTVDDPAATRAGLTVGTPAYLSPEQAVGGDITPACDLYSTTIVLYEMITGRCPFEDKDPLSMLGAHVGRVPPALVQVAPELELPAGLEELVQKGLAKLVGERIASAVDYLTLMEQISPSPIVVRSPTLASQPVIALPGSMLGTPASGTPVVLGTAATSNLTPVATGSAGTAAGPVAVALTPLPPRVATAVAARGKPVGDDDATERLIVEGEGEGDLPPALPHPKVPTVATAMLPVSPVAAVAIARPSVADGREIPKKWIVIGAFVIVGMLIVALVILAVHVSSSEANTPAPAAPVVLPPAPVATPPVPASKKAAQVPPADAAPAESHDDLPPPPPPPPPKKHGGGRPRPAGH